MKQKFLDLVRRREEVESAYTACIRYYHLGIVAFMVWLSPAGIEEVLPALKRSCMNQENICGDIATILPFLWIFCIFFGLWRLSPQSRELILYGRLRPRVAIVFGILLGCLSRLPLVMGILAFRVHYQPPELDGDWMVNILNASFICMLWPPVEEFLIHFVLQTKLQRYGAWISIVMTSLIFATLHLQTLGSLPTSSEVKTIFLQLVPWIIITSLARFYTGSMLMLYFIHATFNILAYIL